MGQAGRALHCTAPVCTYMGARPSEGGGGRASSSRTAGCSEGMGAQGARGRRGGMEESKGRKGGSREGLAAGNAARARTCTSEYMGPASSSSLYRLALPSMIAPGTAVRASGSGLQQQAREAGCASHNLFIEHFERPMNYILVFVSLVSLLVTSVIKGGGAHEGDRRLPGRGLPAFVLWAIGLLCFGAPWLLCFGPLGSYALDL